MVLVPSGPGGAVGSRLSWIGLAPTPYQIPPRPTQCISLTHSATRQVVRVPLDLPQSTPTIERWANRVVYNYGSDTVEVLFLADGSVDVVYNSGLLRGP